jgi:hypothetical protein
VFYVTLSVTLKVGRSLSHRWTRSTGGTLCRSRAFSAPAPSPLPRLLGSRALFALAALWLLPLPAPAGTYSWTVKDANGNITSQSPSISGGSYIAPGPQGTPVTSPDIQNGSSYSGSSGGNSPASCTGDITTIFVWQPSAGQTLVTDPPPVVVVQQTSTVTATVVSGGSTGACNSGFTKPDGTPIEPDGTVSWIPGGNNNTVTMSRTRYLIYTSSGTTTLATVPLPLLKAKAVVTTPGGYGGSTSSLNYAVNIAPVSVTLLGTTPANGTQALTGQQLTTVLNVPGGFSVSHATGQTGYQWTITGNLVNKVFKNYDYNLTSNQLALLTATDLQAVSPSFYDSAMETVNATCTVTLLAPDGITQIPVTVKSKDVSMLKPTASWGTNQYLPGIGFTDDPINQRFQANELWYPLSITVPLPFSGGTGCLAQLITPSRRIARNALNGKSGNYYYKTPHINADGTTSWILPGQGLDSGFPYPVGFTIDQNGQPHSVMPNGGYTWGVSGTGYSGDSPSQTYTTGDLDGGGTDWYESTAADFFSTWLMYCPSGGVWVPLQRVDWSWIGTATKDASGHWAAVGVANAPASATNTNDPPQWSISLQANTQLHP